MPVCIGCSTPDESVEFDTIPQLLEHTRGGHVSRAKKELPPPRKPVKPSATELAAAKETKVTTALSGQLTEHSKDTTVVTVKPLELHYRWIGTHSSCGTEPKTIEAKVGTDVIVVAYCIGCDMQLKEMKIPAIPKS